MYLGTIEAAFSALMRLSLRLRGGAQRPARRARRLPRRPAAAVRAGAAAPAGLVTGVATALLARGIGVEWPQRSVMVVARRAGVRRSSASCCCRWRSSAAIPSACWSCCCRRSRPIARVARPDDALDRARRSPTTRRGAPAATPDEAADEANEAAKAYIDTAEQEGIIEGEERRLLQSIVDFGDTLVREVMTPRPDIVAIRDDATVGDVRALFREQEYSRFPVYKDSLDNIAGFVFVKDLVVLEQQRRLRGRSRRCCGRRSSCRRPSACRSC